mgnify:CR=1 FL=1
MQKMIAYARRVCATLCVLSALSFAVRWAQNMSIFDPKTHLAAPGAAASWFLILFTLASLIGLAVLLLPLLSYGLDGNPSAAIRGGSNAYKTLCTLIGAILCLAGAVLMLKANDELYPLLRKVLGTLAILSGIGILCTGRNGKSDTESPTACFYTIVPVLFGCFWLIVSYKDHSADPVIWGYAVEIAAIAVATVALYLIAGFVFCRPRLFPTCMASAAAALLCFMALGDDRAMVYQVFFACLGLFFLITLYCLISGLNPQLRRHFHLRND